MIRELPGFLFAVVVVGVAMMVWTLLYPVLALIDRWEAHARRG